MYVLQMGLSFLVLFTLPQTPSQQKMIPVETVSGIWGGELKDSG
jgi:hypothetical protein